MEYDYALERQLPVLAFLQRVRPKRFFVCEGKLNGFRSRSTMLLRSHQKVVEDSLRVTKLFRFISVSI